MNVIDKLKLWARLAPPVEPRFPDGRMVDLPGGRGICVLLAIDGAGRVFQIEGGQVVGARWRCVINGRTALLETMDTLDVQDRPEIEDAK